MTTAEADSNAATFAQKLLHWFDAHGRKDLPWQQDISPYRVWVSEIMLQQTQVTTVIPYFERFMERFPKVESLAAASQDEVLHLWTGLGYYARARNLHRTAQQVMTGYNGEFPLTVEELESLPGIGRSTAGAIVAICTDTPAAILDGNVKRVLARCFGIEGWPGQSKTLKALWAKAESLTPQTRVADYTQAIMDLGAMTCTRSKPDCVACPFDTECVARLEDRIDEFPGRKPKKTLPVRKNHLLVIENQKGNILLEKRPAQGLWGGLWSLPVCDAETLEATIDTTTAHLDLEVLEQQALPGFRHTFTHFHMEITPIHLRVKAPGSIRANDDLRWHDRDHPGEIGLAKPTVQLINRRRQS